MNAYRLALAFCVAALVVLSFAYLHERQRVDALEGSAALTRQAEAENADYIEWLETELARYEAGRPLWRDYVWRRNHRAEKDKGK